MIVQAAARSISQQVKTWLDRGQSVTQTASVFKSACNLVTDDNETIALVTPCVGDGPFNVVIDRPVDFYGTIGSSANATSTPDRFIVGRLEIDLQEAVVWEPRPEWQALRARCITRWPVLSHAEPSWIKRLHALCARHARHSVFFPLLGGCPEESIGGCPEESIGGCPEENPRTPGNALEQAMLDRAQSALSDLRAGWDGDQKRLYRGSAALAGLGGGLTPAGDDFLAGAMLWAWLVHPTPGAFCRSLVKAAAHRTNTLSGAFLRAAARGQCSAAWHALLAALGTGAPLNKAVHRILTHGATSGADALLGFLCLSGHCTRRDS